MPLLEEAVSGASGLAAAKSKLLSKVRFDGLVMTPEIFCVEICSTTTTAS